MKIKSWIIVLLIITVLLFYNLFAYRFANKIIDRDTRYTISSYLDINYNITKRYKYIKALDNGDGSISVYIKIDREYYCVKLSNREYNILQFDQDVPSYIKRVSI